MTQQAPTDTVLRERIAAALERAAPVDATGASWDRFEGLFAGRPAELPATGLRFDEGRCGLVAEPFAQAFAGPFYVPFDFEQLWAHHRTGSASACAREHLLLLAARLRHRSLPTLDDAIAARLAG